MRSFALAVLALLALAAPAAALSATATHRDHAHTPTTARVSRRTHPRKHRAHRRPRRARGASAGGCPGTTAAARQANLSAIRAAVLCLVNRERTQRGLPTLKEDSHLDRSAQGWTQTMVSTGQFSHGADFAARISAAGFNWSAAGENIATGFPTPAAVVAGWMASPGHCRNILDPDYSAIGIGMVAAPVSGFASGPATWTEDFGLPMGSAAPSSNEGPANGCPY
jgi:uncharacterized protein YkwD